eukprot:COSAG06_NODE_1792_length_8393_cov_4.896552_2_plen_281_part_00
MHENDGRAALLAGGLSICHQQAASSASATRSRQMRRQQQLLLLLLQLLLLGVGATAAAAAAPALAAPTRPRVEYTEGEAALGIDDAPRFGWTLPVATVRGEEQLAYQLTVTHAGTNAVVWDSQRVVSNTTQFVALPAGTALEPDTSYLWAVRWWSSSSAGSASSATPSPWLHSSFSTGIGSNSTELAGWKGAQWIVPTKVRGEGQGNQMRKHFSLPPGGKAVTRAALYIGVENVGIFLRFLAFVLSLSWQIVVFALEEIQKKSAVCFCFPQPASATTTSK